MKWLLNGFIVFTCLLSSLFIMDARAQTSQYLQQGNKYYDQQKWAEAANDYSKVLQKDPNNTTGLFNLGNSLYQQQKWDSSRKVMTATEKAAKDKTGKAAANYNIGNTYMSEKKWEDAVKAYKQTLRNNPQDADAKYNLSYAEEMLKKQNQENKDKNKQDNKDKQNKDQKDKEKQKQQNKDQDKNKQDKDKQDQNKDDQNKDQNKEQQHPQGQPSKLSPQQADQILNALQQQEKKLQDKMKKEKGTPVRMQKDW